MFESDTLATVVSGPYKGNTVLIDTQFDGGNWLCYLSDTAEGSRGAIIHQDDLRPWIKVQSIDIKPDGTIVIERA